MNIRMYGFAVATAALLAVQTVQAQPVNGCPAGQAMQSSDPGGRNITCVPIPDTANIFNLLNAETAARQTADDALHRRIDALTETDIVGKWSVSGETSCLQSTTGFNANFNPNIVPGGTTIVSQLTASSMGTRTFTADHRGTSDGRTNALSFPTTVFGPPPPNVNLGGASVAGINGSFSWSIEADGTLRIDDDFPIVQPFLEPVTRQGWTATIDKLPPFTGYVSKDKKTIVLSHPGMQIETSTTRDQNGNFIGSSQRFCTRHRVLTPLAD
jgi:hypothetical protein